MGAPHASPLDSLSSELRSSIPCTGKCPKELTSQVTPIEALPHLDTDEHSVFAVADHLAIMDGMFGVGVSRYDWFSLNSSRLETRLDPLVPVFTLDPLEVPPKMS